MLLLALPCHLLSTACRHTRSSFCRKRCSSRRTSNHRLRCYQAHLRSGGAGVIKIFTARPHNSLKARSAFRRGRERERESQDTNQESPSEDSASSSGSPSSSSSPFPPGGTSCPSHPTFSSSDVETLLNSFDVIHHFRTLRSCRHMFDPHSNHSVLPSTDPRHTRILMEARGLQTALRRCKHETPMEGPTVCISSRTHELPMVIDAGASCSVSPAMTDFKSAPVKADTNQMEGLNGHTTEVLGSGEVEWDIEDANGVRNSLITQACCVPTANTRLFSPQGCMTEECKRSGRKLKMTLDAEGIAPELNNGGAFKFPIQSGSDLPFMLTHKALDSGSTDAATKGKGHERRVNRFANLATFLCSNTFKVFNQESLFNTTTAEAAAPTLGENATVLQRSNWNPTEAQRELLLWHNRLGHVNVQHAQSLLAKQREDDNKRIICPSNHKASHCKPCPLCEACQCAKQKRRNPPSTHVKPRPDQVGLLSRNVPIPGQRVSVDLHQSAVKGRLPCSFGKEKEDQRCTGGAIFVDHATKLVCHQHQFSTTASETINSKHQFEHCCDGCGIRVRECVGDNNPFHSIDWRTDCFNQGQVSTPSGVGAHHQNCAERTIQTIFNMAGAMLLHFAMHWPQAASTDLWPFAADHAVCIWNQLPDKQNELSPAEHFAQSSFPHHHHLQRLHVFGCPVCVLDPRLQDGKKSPKWERRSRRAICVGASRMHSTTVHLVLNPDAGKTSPQCHAIFDDTFSTVFSDGAFNQNAWDSILISNVERHPDADDAPDTIPCSRTDAPNERENDTSHTPQLPFSPPSARTDPISSDRLSPTTPERPVAQSPARPSPSQVTFSDPLISPEGAASLPEGAPPSTEGATPTTPNSETPRPSPTSPSTPIPVLRKSTRDRKPIDRLTMHAVKQTSTLPLPSGSRQVTLNSEDNRQRAPAERLNQQCLAGTNWDSPMDLCQNTKSTPGAFFSEHNQNKSHGNAIDCLNPAAFITMANKEDDPTFKEAMASPEAAGFVKAMEIETATPIELQVHDVVPRPVNHKAISGVWALKKKRFPDGSVRKLKARHCARGFEQQQGVDCFETFAPVVMWLTVRLLLIMSVLMDPETKQIDCTAAFVHAPIDCLVHVECPIGFKQPGMVWKLNKSLCGLAQSPRNFFQHTKTQLEEKLGFVQSDADPCLFISRDAVCLICADDALPFHKDESAVNRLAKQMAKEKMQFREEESAAGFPGVHTERKEDGTMHLTQRGSAERIVSAMHSDDSSVKPAPTPATGCSPIDADGEEAHGAFSCASAVGQLNCLQGHSRSDITMATSQVARFVHKPERSHEQALIRMGQCPKGTLDKGLILKPNQVKQLKADLHVDAAFACGWGTELGTNPDSVESRTGCIIEIADCPAIWVSKLQSAAAASTMESECTALSMALRAFIPLQAVVKSVIKGLQYPGKEQITLKATVHEDNQGALVLADPEPGRHTVRSKFHALKLHWFGSWIKKSEISIQFIDTELQKADYLTKAMPSGPFQRNRALSVGWQSSVTEPCAAVTPEGESSGSTGTRILVKKKAAVYLLECSEEKEISVVAFLLFS